MSTNKSKLFIIFIIIITFTLDIVTAKLSYAEEGASNQTGIVFDVEEGDSFVIRIGADGEIIEYYKTAINKQACDSQAREAFAGEESYITLIRAMYLADYLQYVSEPISTNEFIQFLSDSEFQFISLRLSKEFTLIPLDDASANIGVIEKDGVIETVIIMLSKVKNINDKPVTIEIKLGQSNRVQ